MSLYRVFVTVSAVWLTAALITVMLAYPGQVLEAALTGVGIWWDVLFPALFPFIIIAELLLSFGIVHFFGTLLDPLMRPLFRVPGIGGFVMAMGFASGYPVGAKLTSQLWDQRLINRIEGERLVSFTSTSDPIFLIGAVAVGFFHNPEIAPILAVSHYGAGVIIGLMMRFHAGHVPLTPPAGAQEGSIFRRALSNMHDTRIAQQRPFGDLLRDAAVNALRMIIVIGGLVVFFSVMIEILNRTNLLHLLGKIIAALLAVTDLPAGLSDAFINGLFEVTLGAKSAGDAAGVGLMHKAMAGAFVLSWAGLSVHAQIVSLMSHTGMRYVPFLIARLLHGLIASVLVFFLWDYLRPESAAAQLWLHWLAPVDAAFWGGSWGSYVAVPISAGLAYFAAMLVSSLVIYGLKHILNGAGGKKQV